jgi:hypothetical protein
MEIKISLADYRGGGTAKTVGRRVDQGTQL